MRRVLAFLAGKKVATAATASALSILTTVTLVAGGLVATDVVNFGRDRGVAVIPPLDEPAGPIIVKGTTIDKPTLATDASVGDADRRAVDRPTNRARPLRTASLKDMPDRVTGGISTALDAEEPGRMEEESTLDRIQELLEGSDDDPPDETDTEDEATPDDEGAQPDEDGSEDRILTKTLEGTTDVAVEVVEPAQDLTYSGTDAAGSASPSA
jgi:hypothetical protein